MTWPIPLAPGGTLARTAGAIRMPASSPALAMAVANQLSWQLGRLPAGLIAAYRWPNQSDASWTGYACHRTHPNANSLLVVAVIEGTPTQAGTLTFTPAGGGATTLITTDTASGDDPFDASTGWSVVAAQIDLVSTGLVCHSFTTSSLYLHSLTILELPRASLDPANDEAVYSRAGGYAGYEVGRQITDSSTAGIPALIDLTKECRDHSVRHVNLSWPDSLEWSGSKAAPNYANMVDAMFSTTDFGFPHLARRIRNAEGSRAYDVRIHARTTATSAAIRLRSKTTTDTADCTTSSATVAWLTASSTLSVDCDADDEIFLEASITAGSGEVYCDGFALVEV